MNDLLRYADEVHPTWIAECYKNGIEKAKKEGITLIHCVTFVMSLGVDLLLAADIVPDFVDCILGGFFDAEQVKPQLASRLSQMNKTKVTMQGSIVPEQVQLSYFIKRRPLMYRIIYLRPVNKVSIEDWARGSEPSSIPLPIGTSPLVCIQGRIIARSKHIYKTLGKCYICITEGCRNHSQAIKYSVLNTVFTEDDLFEGPVDKSSEPICRGCRSLMTELPTMNGVEMVQIVRIAMEKGCAECILKRGEESLLLTEGGFTNPRDDFWLGQEVELVGHVRLPPQLMQSEVCSRAIFFDCLGVFPKREGLMEFNQSPLNAFIYSIIHDCEGETPAEWVKCIEMVLICLLSGGQLRVELICQGEDHELVKMLAQWMAGKLDISMHAMRHDNPVAPKEALYKPPKQTGLKIEMFNAGQAHYGDLLFIDCYLKYHKMHAEEALACRRAAILAVTPEDLSECSFDIRYQLGPLLDNSIARKLIKGTLFNNSSINVPPLMPYLHSRGHPEVIAKKRAFNAACRAHCVLRQDFKINCLDEAFAHSFVRKYTVSDEQSNELGVPSTPKTTPIIAQGEMPSPTLSSASSTKSLKKQVSNKRWNY